MWCVAYSKIQYRGRIQVHSAAYYNHSLDTLSNLHRKARCEWWGLNITDQRKDYRYLVGHLSGKHLNHTRNACKRGSHMEPGPPGVPRQGGSVRTDK